MRDQPEPPEEDPGSTPEGNLRPLQPVVLAAWAAVGLVLGWGLHVGFVRWGRTPPTVAWGQPLALLLLALILAYVAWVTHRTVQVRRERIESHQMVNRLVLARACALVAALVGAGYLGYGLSWLGDSAHLAEARMWRSFAAAAACAVGIAAAIVLERACRTPTDAP